MHEIRMRLANIGGVFIIACASLMRKPSPWLEATNSPTIAPTTQSVALILSPETT